MSDAKQSVGARDILERVIVENAGRFTVVGYDVNGDGILGGGIALDLEDVALEKREKLIRDILRGLNMAKGIGQFF